MAASNTRRHPAELTSDRLADASERWNDKFTGEELDMIGTLPHLQPTRQQPGQRPEATTRPVQMIWFLFPMTHSSSAL